MKISIEDINHNTSGKFIVESDDVIANVTVSNCAVNVQAVASGGDNSVSINAVGEILEACAQGKSIAAIKALRDETGWGLRESKGFFDTHFRDFQRF